MSRPTGSTTAHTGQLHSSTLGVNEHQELDWRYLSTTDAYSEYSSQDEYDDDDDEYLQDDIVIPSSHPPGHRTRPLLVPSRSNSGTFPSSSPSQALSSSHASNGEADDSTDTIKSMRARALDKINGRGASATTTASTSTKTSTNEYAKSPPRGASSQSRTNSNGINNTKRSLTTGTSGASYSTHRPSTLSSTTTQGAYQEERVSGLGSKLKRRSFGLERSNLPKITTKFDTQQPNPPSFVRKRNSGSFKSQQVLLTSEDEDLPGTVFQDRTRYTESGGILLSELKALKARVQELEMERMNRSLSGLSVQSPQLLTPQSDRPNEEPTPLSHSEKLQNILQKHRGSTGVSNPLRSPALSATLPREGSIRAGTLSRLPSNTPKVSSTTTQHVTLLQEAFKTYEKAMSPSTGPSSPVQAMSNVVQNAINVNQTIRTLIKADVSLVDSSSMSSLQRASDDQIRSLTEALLSLATQGPFDRTMTPSEAAGPRPYSPRLSMHTRFDQGQRLSLGMVGQELGAPEPYLSRPYSSAAESSPTPNLISSGYPSRTNSIASTISNDNRRSTRQGYNSDYAERQGYAGVVGRNPAIGSVSREPSPPHDANGSGQGRMSLPVHLQNHQFATSTPRSIQSPRFASPGLDVGDSDSVASAQVARRQASVRNILARYSQMSPTGLPQRDELESAASDGHGGHQLENPSSRHLPQPSTRLSESMISSGGTLGRSSMRPLSQQDNHNMRSSMSNIQGQVSQGRGSIRNRSVFSEDEGGWGTVSVGQLDPRSRPGYVTHGRLQQEDDHGYPVGYLERSFQGHKGFSDGEGPMRQMIQRQRHQQQDMAMTTPSMSSPTSSPSSSSRAEGPSVTLSNGYGGVDGRYHLSPRGPAHPSTFPRQQSLIGMSNSLLEYGHNPGTIGRAMAKTGASLGEHAFYQQHALDGLSPQAQAQFGHILAHD